MRSFTPSASRRTARCPHRRRYLRTPHGFTLVELLVVIAIIGVLVALLLPAVQAAREAARRTSCVNNITQLSLSAHSYEFHFEKLPPGSTNPAGPIRSEPTGQHVSWMIDILPYLEQQALYSHFDREAGAYAEANAPVRAARVSVMHCPSSPFPDRNDAQTVARSSYAGCHHDVEAPIDVKNNGLLFLNSEVRYSDIFDGSSNTLLMSETRYYPDDLGWVSGTRATLRNTSSLEPPRAYLPSQQTQPDGNQSTEVDPVDPLFVGGFGSSHNGGVNGAFADGSTRFISENIDLAVFRLLGNRADGEILDANY